MSMSPESVGFDGESVRWSDVTEIRTGPLLDVLSSTAIDREIDRILSKLPPVPFRKRLVKMLAELLAGLSLGVVQAAVQRSTAAGELEEPTVPMAVVYSSRFGRKRELRPGLFATLCCAALPGVVDAMTHTASSKGIPVVAAAPPRARRHADSAQAVFASLESRFRKAQDSPKDTDLKG
jgi:hypothetical protein